MIKYTIKQRANIYDNLYGVRKFRSPGEEAEVKNEAKGGEIFLKNSKFDFQHFLKIIINTGRANFPYFLTTTKLELEIPPLIFF